MTTNTLMLMGGIGLFLLGMQIMTGALRQLASHKARDLLARFTVSPLTGAVTGACTTAVIQSSSATMVTVIGFVGAGMLSFSQALGVIYGANIGTTITGWVVTLVGFKLQLGLASLPLILIGALMRLSGNTRIVQIGAALAGFSLVFVGLDLMKDGASVFQTWLTPESFPADNWFGRIQLLLLGCAMTVVIQSSSAGVAMTLVLLGAGTITLSQGAAMVIGMDVGTTVTALLATLGGSRDMRRTAIAHVVYNLVTGSVAFLLLGVVVPILGTLFEPQDPAALVTFHTLFNLIGAMCMLPFTKPFARLIISLVPGTEDAMTQALDKSLLQDASASLLAAHTAATEIAKQTFAATAAFLTPGSEGQSTSEDQDAINLALDELEAFLEAIRLEPGYPQEAAAFSALLHETDHLRRLSSRLEYVGINEVLVSDAVLRRPALVFARVLEKGAEPAVTGMSPDRLARLEHILSSRVERHRRGLLLGEHAGLFSLSDVFGHTDAMRWLQRSLHHAERIGHYDREVKLRLRHEKVPQT